MTAASSNLILKQYYLGCLAHASYMIGDRESASAVIVDPQRDVEQYLEDAEAEHLTIRFVFLTHFHADFVAGHLDLRDRTGARICLGAEAQAEYDFMPLHDGEMMEFGKVRLQILATPGHTPEGISILVFDRASTREEPYAVLTGDTLFIGDVGRPDLTASIGTTAHELAGRLFESLHTKLLPLPDATLVYPAHGAGSMCGKNLSKDTVSTIGVQRRYNYALQPMTREQFIEIVTADQPEAPSYFSYDADLNRHEHATLQASLERALRPLEMDEVLRLATHGTQIVDVRDPADFAAAHLIGSINIGLGGKYATWAGTLLPRDRSIVILAEPGREQEGATRLGRIGFDDVKGYLRDGMGALLTRPDLLGRTDRITVGTLAELGEAAYTLDVRAESEWKSGHIKGAHIIPLNHLEARLDELPAEERINVHCQSGYRSSIAASLLKRHGFNKVVDVIGGFSAWQASGLPVVTGS